MLIKSIMSRPVESVGRDCSIATAAETMERLGVGVLPVCEAGRIVGMITDRDITVRATAHGADPHQTPVSECMSPEAFFCLETQDTADAEAFMQDKQVRRVPIVNEDYELVGMVALADLVRKTVETDEVERTLWKISQPSSADVMR